ncbi:E3 ubiquitin ligase SCF complex, Skp subunit [Ceratobasidium sp. AG-I]|nr:E3 ubiquitin ligase SCF complex, Skp subunit [Ceratobasidium sp. AG-I]KAF8600708.1 E3 ubiquitin ligase SCF complex, Skp subunit [Ceratobasidium sp. AG-I]
MILVTSDNEQFEVDWDIYRRIGIFSPQDEPANTSNEPVPLANVSSSVLKKVLEYLEHHRNDPLPPPESSDKENSSGYGTQRMGEWDSKFIQLDQKMVFDIILAANYLDIKPLLNLGTKRVADMIKGQTPQEIGKMFNLVNDFTPEEEAHIRKAEGWGGDGL